MLNANPLFGGSVKSSLLVMLGLPLLLAAECSGDSPRAKAANAELVPAVDPGEQGGHQQ